MGYQRPQSMAGGATRVTLRARRGLARGVGPLRLCDQGPHLLLVAAAQQLDRVGLPVDDRLEELLAVPVGGKGGLRPPAFLVEQHRQARVWLAEALGDLA